MVKAGPNYHNKRTGFTSYFLSFGDGETRIEIMNRKEVDVNNLLEALGYNHIAISVGSKEAVDEITRKLKKDGYAILEKPRTTGDGYFESLFLSFDNLLIELTV